MTAKKSFGLSSALEETAVETPAPAPTAAEPAHRPGQPYKRLSVSLDYETYQALREYAFKTSETHQTICETAIRKLLKSKLK